MNKIIIAILIVVNLLLSLFIYLRTPFFNIKQEKINTFREFTPYQCLEGVLFDTWNFNPNGIYLESEGLELNKKPILIIRIAESNCGECIDTLMMVWNQHKFSKRIDNVRFLISYENEAYVAGIIKRYNLIKDKVIRYNTKMKNSFDFRDAPYILVVDKKGLAKMPFLPSKSLPDLTRKYLRVVEKKFQNREF